MEKEKGKETNSEIVDRAAKYLIELGNDIRNGHRISELSKLLRTAKNDINRFIIDLETGSDPVVDYLKDIVKEIENAGYNKDMRNEILEETISTLGMHIAESEKSEPNTDLFFDRKHLGKVFVRNSPHEEYKEVHLTPTEYGLLHLLYDHEGVTVEYATIFRRVWKDEYLDDRHLDDKLIVKLYVRYLRHKIEKNPRSPEFILTERGFGYRFQNRRQ